jgi:hypothetical protein
MSDKYQAPNEHGHVLTTAALWKMYVEDPETPPPTFNERKK